MDPADRAYVTNLRPGGWPTIVGRALVIVSIWVSVIAAPWLALDWYAGLCAQVPEAPDILAHDELTVGTDILGSDGVRLGGTRAGRRAWVAFEDIPPTVVSAFLAAEDEAFFLHDGVDLRGLARAAWVNLRERRLAQGGSTITQQVAKMIVGRERSFDRKLREAVLARRIEQRFSKREILEAWLNRIYLGAGAHGVAAAAERYFARPLDQLEIHQVALIAGLTAAPSRFDPFHNPQGALERRSYVLRRMAETGLITEAQRELADDAPLELDRARPDDASAPYLVDETTRRLRGLELDWPADTRGRVVETTASLALQRQAVAEVARGAERVGRHRQDPVRLMHLASDEVEAFLADARRHQDEPDTAGTTWAGVVVELVEGPLDDPGDDTAARLVVDLGHRRVQVRGDGLRWARISEQDDPRNQKKRKGRKKKRRTVEPRALASFVSVGDVVQVRLLEDLDTAELLPVAEVQGALVSIELDSGGIRALAGGTGFDVSQYNRATRACRQPGSAFKPILFALALARGLTPATLVHDFPVRYEDGRGRLIWEPRNADRDFEGTLTLASALARSRNLPAVKLAAALGIPAVASTARALGIDSPMKLTPSLALGASCVKPLEMTSVYGAFARRGHKLDPTLVRAAYTDDGRLVYDRGAVFDPAGPLDARLHRLARRLREPNELVLRPDVAYQTTYLLRQVVVGGTGYAARQLDAPAAGKTGTTNSYDVWFVGFTDDLLTGVWLGDDRNRRELGEGESGGTSALPVWMAYMASALEGRKQRDPLDDPPPGVDFARIDPGTGKLAHPDGPGRWMPFKEGATPTDVAPGPTERDAAVADILDRQ